LIVVVTVAAPGCSSTNNDAATGRASVATSSDASTSASTAPSSSAITATAPPLVPSVVEHTTGPPASSETSTPEDIDDVVADAVAGSSGGASVLLVRDGVETDVTAGVRNNAGDPMTASTPFRVGSISKPFVAVMVLQLVDEGRVDLDAPLRDYLPDTQVGADVTIRDLLSHRSGIPNYTDVKDFVDDVLANRARQFSPEDILGYVASIPPSPAGQRFAYSNTNFVLLGQLIEHLEGVDLNTALQRRIATPLGLQATRFDTTAAEPVDGLAAGWSRDVLAGDPDDPYGSIASSAFAAGALVSTTGDLAAFLAALFGGKLMSGASLTEMTKMRPEGYGLGIGGGLDFAFNPGQPAFGHGGAIPGYLAFMGIQPDNGDTLVVLVNNDDININNLINRVRATGW
jgi:D-alanyl-D-alanine carboxypeptidase